MSGESYNHEGDRRRSLILSEEDIDKIAEKAADKAIEKIEAHIYSQVGKSFINKFFQFLGAALIAIAYYLHDKGLFTFK